MNQPNEISGGIGDPGHEQIAARAYAIWVSEGYPEGREDANWHEAERQLLVERSTGSVIQEDSEGAPLAN